MNSAGTTIPAIGAIAQFGVSGDVSNDGTEELVPLDFDDGLDGDDPALEGTAFPLPSDERQHMDALLRGTMAIYRTPVAIASVQPPPQLQPSQPPFEKRIVDLAIAAVPASAEPPQFITPPPLPEPPPLTFAQKLWQNIRRSLGAKPEDVILPLTSAQFSSLSQTGNIFGLRWSTIEGCWVFRARAKDQLARYLHPSRFVEYPDGAIELKVKGTNDHVLLHPRRKSPAKDKS